MDETDDGTEYDQLVEENRAHWDELARHHPDTDHYDVDAFLAGESTLRDLERAELDPTGDRMLHLQCHFGLDTLSWVRNEGVTHATGVDFSPTAIETARELRDRAEIDPNRARFVESDVYDLRETLSETFDVAYASYGTIYWLPDLGRWATVIAQHLDPGGIFYLADGHPFANPFHYESTAEDLQVAHPYFNERPITDEADGSYAGWNFDMNNRINHGFAHPTGEIVTALVDAGLHIQFVHDHPWSFFKRFEAMEEGPDGRWRLPGLAHDLPFTISLKARLPA